MTLFFILWFCFLILWLLVYFGIHFKINQPLGPLTFGSALVLYRLGNWGYRLIRKAETIKLPTIARPMVEKVSDYISAYQLKHTEVILGLDTKNRPVRIDVLDEHTMLGASSGGAKTWLLHSMLIQLFGKGGRFMDNVKVYVCDFKGHPKDMWQEWQPLLAGFARRSDTGDISSCLELLKGIDRLLQVNVNERILLIIEDAVILTADKEGNDLLGTIASQLRLNGSLIVTIQHPHYRHMQTFTKHNIQRRIAGLVNNVSQGEVILEVRPKEHELPEEKGRYLLREPGKRNLIAFTAMKPDLPAEIKEVVQNGIDILAEADDRLKIFREVAQGKKRGAAVIGADTMGKQTKWLNNAQFNFMIAYRNFVKAGAFIPPEGKGSRSRLACDFEEGFAKVRTFIEEKRWEKEPEKII